MSCRESALRCLENKVQLLLAHFIAYTDRNENLNLLKLKSVDDVWIGELWLDILMNKDALSMSYCKLLMVHDSNRETQNVVVSTSGFNGHRFSAHFPFSWLLKENIDAIFESYDKSFDSRK